MRARRVQRTNPMRPRLPSFVPHSRDARPWQRLAACLVALTVLTVIFTQLWAAAEPSATAAEHEGAASGPPKGRLVQLNDGNPHLALAGKEDKADVFRCAPDVRVTLNGHEASFSDLKLDDTV